MGTTTFVVLILAISCHVCSCSLPWPSEKPIRIAVIGSGIGGSSAAHFIRKKFGAAALEPEIVVFERSEIIGGRIKNHYFEDVVVEAGASVFHADNQNMATFAKLLNLTTIRPFHESGRMAIWDEQSGKFLLEEGEWKLTTIARFLWRYGTSPLTLSKETNKMLDAFSHIYAEADQRPFTRVEDVLARLGFWDASQTTLDLFLASKLRLNRQFVDELVTGVMRVNYGSDLSLNAFAGLVSMAGSGDSLYAVKEGNSAIPRGLLQLAGAEVRLATAVTAITSVPSSDAGGAPQFLLSTASGRAEGRGDTTAAPSGDSGDAAEEAADGGKDERELFDAVVIAAPLEHAAISLDAAGALPPTLRTQRQYRTTHATFVTGALRSSFFSPTQRGAPTAVDGAEKALPSPILTTESMNCPFSSIARVRVFSNATTLYKVFSREPLSAATLSAMFANVTQVTRTPWKAYPYLQPIRSSLSPPKAGSDSDSDGSTPQQQQQPQWPPLRLSPGLFYVGAMETPVSTMETQSVAARNIATLLLKELAAGK